MKTLGLSPVLFCNNGKHWQSSPFRAFMPYSPAAALRNQGCRFLLPGAQWFTAGTTCTFHPGPAETGANRIAFLSFSGKKPVVEAWPMDWPHDQNCFYAAAGSFHLDNRSLLCYTVLATVIQLKQERW